MKIGIHGFQGCGKTTVFNALTGSHAATAVYSGGHAQSNIAVVKVPDERLDQLGELIRPRKLVHAAVEYVDVAGIDRSHVEQRKGLGETQLQALANTDALLAVIRAFDDGSGIPVDVSGDAEAILLELLLSDMEKIENRIPKLEKLVHKVAGKEREQGQLELSTLKKIKAALEKEERIGTIALAPDEEKIIRGFRFLTEKPILFLVNVGEEGIPDTNNDSLKVPDLILPGDRLQKEGLISSWTTMCAEIESEIARLSPEEREAFLKDFHIKEPAAQRIIRFCYNLLGYISFFTLSPKEVHAWTIKKGTTAVNAAGTVHSDMERGFIRAEVVPWDKFLETGGFSQARKTADLTIEGKDYVVHDGDIVNFLFNV